MENTAIWLVTGLLIYIVLVGLISVFFHSATRKETPKIKR